VGFAGEVAVKYIREIPDYETGELHTISIGEDLTISELAIRLRIVPSNLVQLLEMLGIVQPWEFNPLSKQWDRYRVRPEAVEEGLGFRIVGEDGKPADRLSGEACKLVRRELPGFVALLKQRRAIRDCEHPARAEHPAGRVR
jgi:hypothetical protein